MADLQNILGSVFVQKRNDILVAVAVVVVVLMIIIPLPTFLLDFFMSLNLMLGLVTILTVLFAKSALDFSVFPTLLLVSTMFGLALNVSSTRLILSLGENFDGKLVRAFGTFVVGAAANDTSGLVIGIIMFVILIVIQVLVVTKGATRVAEVAARFTLDALPGKQMAIDAEYNSGLINEEDKNRKQTELQTEVDFYGAMDGSSKFVSGNVQAGILITLINIVGGLIIGIVMRQESVDTAVSNYISLTVGDGLLSQIPNFLISVSTGILVTRSVSDDSFGKDVTKQFSQQGAIYWITSVALLVLALLPNFPWWILVPLSIVSGLLAYNLSKKKVAKDKAETEAQESAEAKPEGPPKDLPPEPLDPLSLELGYGLIPLVDREQGAELLDRITRIRRESALELGLIVPRIRIIDNMRLEPSEYCLKIKGVEVGRGEIRMGSYLAINPGGERENVPGEHTVEPTFGLPAIWINESERNTAERYGYTVVDAPSIIATHLTEIIKDNSAEILGRQEVQKIIDTLKEDYPAVVEEVTKEMSFGLIQKVLQGLLMEQVSIRNMVVILETLGDFASVTKDIGFLIEKVRQALGRQICVQYTDEDKILRVLTIEPGLEQTLIDSRIETAGGIVSALDPVSQRNWLQAVTNAVTLVSQQGFMPIILASEAARPLVKSSTGREIPKLVVLSFPEVVYAKQVESLGEIRIEG